MSTTADAATVPAQARAAAALRKLLPVASRPAALRALRTTIVAAGLFALTYEVLGNPQVATFAAFGSFATLLLASFGGGLRDRLRAHLCLALAGSALLSVGTLVSGSAALATLVTLPVTFVVFYAGVLGPNAASGGIGAMLAYVLPAASPGTAAMIPDRLAGWWLASVAGTAAAIALAPRGTAANPLRAPVARTVEAIAVAIRRALEGAPVEEPLERCLAAEHELLDAFTATPYRPLGLAAPDQALANVVELVAWCTALLSDALHERGDLRDVAPPARELLATCATVLDEIGAVFGGSREEPQLDRLEAEREAALSAAGSPAPAGRNHRREEQTGFHAQALAVAVLATGADALVAERLVTPGELERRRRAFAGMLELASAGRATGRTSTVLRHASVRSVWFVNSLRAAAALSAAVLVAELSSVQHGFWVVLGTLSVLRTDASATGATALSALAGTALGFVIGGVLLVVIGTGPDALWAALPLAIFVAAYTPGTAPFAIGQAAFTVAIAVLFNLLAPVGWEVGIVRIEDVALGCAVSVLVGVLLWPRGVAGVVADDLADCFRAGASFLREGIDWTVGLRDGAPEEASAATTAAVRLDDALRAFLAEQGTKRLAKQELWRLVGGTLRLRLTAYAVATLPPEPESVDAALGALDRRTAAITGFYDRLAGLLEPPRRTQPPVVEPPRLGEDTVVHEGQGSRYTVWLCEHLDHLAEHLDELIGPAEHVAQLRRGPWWR